MKTKTALAVGWILLLAGVFTIRVGCQTSFNPDDYLAFLQDNKDLEAATLLDRHTPPNDYYYLLSAGSPLLNHLFLDSIIKKYGLTEDELALLDENRFIVTERLSFNKVSIALDNIFEKDLPVFVSTDAILDALHISYSNLLKEIELNVMYPVLADMLEVLHSNIPWISTRYSGMPGLQKSMEDIDLYVTVAFSLLTGEDQKATIVPVNKLNEVLGAIGKEEFANIELFTDIPRLVDFSQFTVRGHYLGDKILERYFKCMMWLGRMEFILANAPREWYEAGFTGEGLKRLNADAVMLNELCEYTGAWNYLDELDGILELLIGESDNLQPHELSGLLSDLGITHAGDMFTDALFRNFQEKLLDSPEYNQQILSSFLKGNMTPEPTPMPFSYRLLGQRYIIDSHVFSNLVYDNIVYQERKICRMMPDPLDAMFVLGNDNALPLLEEELETWKYASQMAAMRYLAESHDPSFWNKSLYNSWLQAIRFLNPNQDQSEYPLFMRSVAWQQQKLNTQLASWSQLRHDNLLYTKQSYSHGSECSYPHSFVEPYPEFYRQIGTLATKAIENKTFNRLGTQIVDYFRHVRTTMDTLGVIAEKELNHQLINQEEADFLKRMLFHGMISGPRFDGWYIRLLYGTDGDDLEWLDHQDFIIADVHTQPTDCAGNIIGNVLHVGTGRINLGVFLAESPSNGYQPMAYVGPVMSYYETITGNFERLNDKIWGERVKAGKVPKRPDWVNVYLADSLGNRRPPGRELAGILYTGIRDTELLPEAGPGLEIYPNPVSERAEIRYWISDHGSRITDLDWQLIIVNGIGQVVEHRQLDNPATGEQKYTWDTSRLPEGVYFVRLRAGSMAQVRKVLVVR